MTELIYKIIKPETEVRATLVCVHGMQEHHARYIPFARELSKQGIAVLIYDLPGHGEAFKDELGYFANQNGDEVLIPSVEWAKVVFPELSEEEACTVTSQDKRS